MEADDDEVDHEDNHNDEDLVEVVVENIKGDQLLQLPHLLPTPVHGGEIASDDAFYDDYDTCFT